MFSMSRVLAALGGLLMSLTTLVALAPASSAHTGLPDPAPRGGVVPPAEVPSSAASSGLPLWTVVAIAVAAAVLGAGITYLNMRLGRAHYRRAAHAPTV